VNIDAEVRREASNRRLARRVDGILLLDKPAGPSSNHVLQWVKRLFRAEKAGHTGTLDPFASGLLPVMFGEATKFSSFLLDASKEYVARLVLGLSTSTGDITGDVIERRAVSVREVDVQTAVTSFLGEQLQTPPMHSALKRNGVPLYELARRGETVAREPRRIVIESIAIERIDGSECDIRVRCSKGTYIRVLGEDIGKVLGCGACLSVLRRTSVASFELSGNGIPPPLESLDLDALDSLLLPIDAGLGHLPRIDLDADNVYNLKFGRSFLCGTGGGSDLPEVRLYDTDSNKFLGLGSLAEGRVYPVRLTVAPTAKIA